MGKTGYKPGDIVELAGTKFVVLDDLGPHDGEPEEGNDLFILALETQAKSRFGDTDNYARSELRGRTANWKNEWFNKLQGHGAIRKRSIDLTTMDGRGRYGELEVKAAPLTVDEARRYAGIIPPSNDAYWLANGWGGPEYVFDGYALRVSEYGDWERAPVSNWYGIRPALVVSESLVRNNHTQGARSASTAVVLS